MQVQDMKDQTRNCLICYKKLWQTKKNIRTIIDNEENNSHSIIYIKIINIVFHFLWSFDQSMVSGQPITSFNSPKFILKYWTKLLYAYGNSMEIYIIHVNLRL